MTLYKTREAAELFGVRRLTVIRWIEAGRLKATKYGRQWRITAAEIERRKRERAKG
jgi:putative resolvase